VVTLCSSAVVNALTPRGADFHLRLSASSPAPEGDFSAALWGNEVLLRGAVRWMV